MAAKRPLIAVNQDHGDLITDARKALADINDPPGMFLRGGVLARVGRDDDGRAVIIPMTTQAIRATLAREIGWRKIKKKTDDGEAKLTPAGVPPIVVDDLFTKADQLGMPVLDQIVTAPVFGPDGVLITAPGYASSARVWYEPVDGMAVRPVSPAPSRAEITAAARFLVAEYLGDFPFDTEASRQHALGTLLLPFARPMIDGPVPLQAVDASTPGSGKGLLQRALMYPALGSMLPALPGVLADDEELRKKLTTSLMRGQQVIRWDNVVDRIDSPVLSSVLVEPIWQDRLLSLNRDIEVKVRSIFLINGNNLAYSHEVARRVVPARLAVHGKHAEQPWLRAGFRHPELIGWAKEHRGELVHAALTLVQGWIAAGMPAGQRSIGSYEQWARVTGGIVEHAVGDPRSSAFLSGLEALYADAVSERDEKIIFCEEWFSRLGGEPALPQHLLAMLGDVEPFSVAGHGPPRSQQTKFGNGLAKMRGQVWGGYQVVKQGRKWRIECVQPGNLIQPPDPQRI